MTDSTDSQAIPDANFRLEHAFTVRPDLVVDKGPARGILLGQHGSNPETDAMFVGKQAETPFRNVWLDTRGAHVVYIMGKRRSGKSYTLGVVAEGLVGRGWFAQTSQPQAVLILDTMNVYLTMPFGVTDTADERHESVRELNKWRLPHERIAIQLFHPRGTTVPSSLSSSEITLRPSDLGADEWCGLFEADPFSDPLGHLMTELHGKVALDGYTDSRNGQVVPPDPVFGINELLAALEHSSELQRYHRDTVESLRRRLHAVRRLPLFSNTGLDMRRLLTPGRISVLLLRELDPQVRSVLVALLIKLVIQLRGLAEKYERMLPIHRSRAELLLSTDPVAAKREADLAQECELRKAEGISRCWIIVDEAHNYMPARGTSASKRPLKKYVDEGRNLGLSIVVATQQPSGLDPSVQRNADVLLIHSLSHHDDIQAAEGMINTNPPSEAILDGRHKIDRDVFEALVRNLPIGYALASTDRANRLFPIRVRPRITVHGGSDY